MAVAGCGEARPAAAGQSSVSASQLVPWDGGAAVGGSVGALWWLE